MEQVCPAKRLGLAKDFIGQVILSNKLYRRTPGERHDICDDVLRNFELDQRGDEVTVERLLEYEIEYCRLSFINGAIINQKKESHDVLKTRAMRPETVLRILEVAFDSHTNPVDDQFVEEFRCSRHESDTSVMRGVIHVRYLHRGTRPALVCQSDCGAPNNRS